MKDYFRLDDQNENPGLISRYPAIGSKRTIQNLIKGGKFPKGKKTSSQITVWSKSEIESWLDKREE